MPRWPLMTSTTSLAGLIAQPEPEVPAMSIAGNTIYQTLPDNTIRLLFLHPGQYPEPIRCVLQSFSLDIPLPYTTLSYVWGDPEKALTITCNDQELQITRSLYNCLQRVRLPDRVHLVWADAICIDQSNNKERAQQVKLMKSIYSNAQRTVAFLGEASWNVDLVTLLGSKIIQLSERYKLEPTRDVRVGESELQSAGLAPKGSEAWAALRDFFQLPWFQRVWIVQEYVVSKDVVFVYGQQTYATTFPGSLLEAIMRHGLAWLLDHGEGDSEEARIGGKHLTRIRWLTRFRSAEQHYRGLQQRTMLDLLDRSILHQASDLHDQIYALQGLASDGSDPQLEPSYDQPVSETYIQTCKYFINTGQPEFLYATGEPRQLLGLPSWVPDWSTPKVTGTLAKNTIQPYRSSDGCDYINFRLSPDSRALTCHGEIVDSLSSFSSLFQFAKDPTDWTEMKPWFTETDHSLHSCDEWG